MVTDFNEINKKYNNLTIKGFTKRPETDKYKSWNTSKWVVCECDCENKTRIVVPLYGVKNGFIKSCGCLKSQKAAATLAENKKANPTPTAVYLTYEGKTLNISEWSEETGIPRSTIMYRLSKELPVEKVLERKDKNDN